MITADSDNFLERFRDHCCSELKPTEAGAAEVACAAVFAISR